MLTTLLGSKGIAEGWEMFSAFLCKAELIWVFCKWEEKNHLVVKCFKFSPSFFTLTFTA